MKREITVEVDFCYGHRLLGYTGKCSHYHGHNARVEVCVSGSQLNALGFIVDFSILKGGLRDWINANWDHHMILNQFDPGFKSMSNVDSWVLAVDSNPTAEWMVGRLAQVVVEDLIPQYEEENIQLVSIKLWETPTSYATWRPDGIECSCGSCCDAD